MARIPLIAGNWKLNLDHLEATHTVQKLAWELLQRRQAQIRRGGSGSPALVHVNPLGADAHRRRQAEVKVGAGHSAQTSGAYTGEVSGTQLAKLNVSYVAVGHSERREYHGESDALVGAKAKAAFDHGIVPIVCVGEGLDVRKEGRQVEYTLAQVDGALEGLSTDRAKPIVIAYEPVWAIGTGEVATPADAQEVCGAIRARVGELYGADVADAVRVLYGGSVKSSNIASIMAEQDVDGVLVGGASLDAEEFAKIARFREHTVGSVAARGSLRGARYPCSRSIVSRENCADPQPDLPVGPARTVEPVAHRSSAHSPRSRRRYHRHVRWRPRVREFSPRP